MSDKREKDLKLISWDLVSGINLKSEFRNLLKIWLNNFLRFMLNAKCFLVLLLLLMMICSGNLKILFHTLRQMISFGQSMKLKGIWSSLTLWIDWFVVMSVLEKLRSLFVPRLRRYAVTSR